jgi:hypothetical protein
MEEKKTIEQEVAKTLLQTEETITIGDKQYTFAPPSVATLVLASEVVSQLPHVALNENRVLEDSLAIAKDCRKLGDLAAILLIGAKHINDVITYPEIEEKRHLWGLFKTKRTTMRTTTKREKYAKELLEDLTPRELHSLTAQIINRMQVGDFFGLTTFLTEINLTRPTKVETEATASGQS